VAGAALCVLVLVGQSHAQASSLQPYQMTRSLQLVQDRIASGDHAALPMQRRLIEMIDERLRQSTAIDFEDDRNFRALLIYGMSGGNPATFETVLTRLDLPDERRALAMGVRDYLVGNPSGAQSAFSEVDINGLEPEVAAFTALVKGSVLAGTDPRRAIALFDHARLLSPGTLVEEAALRRALAIHANAGNAERFVMTASQYARRFLRSPYASQFAQTLVTGIAGLFEHIDRRHIEEILGWMTREQAHTIYLRLARQAAIDGHDTMLAFASAKARQISGEAQTTENVRSLLYSSIASVTSDTVDEVLFKLRQIDRSQLSAEDTALLEAAEAVAAEVVARPGEMPETVRSDKNDELDAEPAPGPASTDRRETHAAAEEEFETDPLITSAREKLDAVDRMLERTRDE
jgi:chemotaxis protein MotC